MTTKQGTRGTRGTRTYRQWLERLSAETVQKSHIDAYRHIVCPRADGYTNGKASALTHEEAGALVDIANARFHAGGYKITAEHTAQGLAWLRSTGTRKGYDMPSEVVEMFDSFRWVGVSAHYTSYRTDYAPVYEIRMSHGVAIRYHTQPWQAGTGVEWWRATGWAS